jgi:uncharacterized phage protein (TIGR01671 family)
MEQRQLKFRAWHRNLLEMHEDVHLLDSFAEMLARPETYEVMQSTGLKDKNGVEIYEGDLLRYQSEDNKNFSAFEVFFHDGDANTDYNIGFSINRVHHHGNVGGGFIPSFKPKTTKQMIVIGNIFQNPELL